LRLQHLQTCRRIFDHAVLQVPAKRTYVCSVDGLEPLLRRLGRQTGEPCAGAPHPDATRNHACGSLSSSQLPSMATRRDLYVALVGGNAPCSWAGRLDTTRTRHAPWPCDAASGPFGLIATHGRNT